MVFPGWIQNRLFTAYINNNIKLLLYVRYSFKSECNCLEIEKKSGKVKVGKENCLNYELIDSFECTVLAADMEHVGQDYLTGEYKLTIKVDDINDTPPRIIPTVSIHLYYNLIYLQ